MLFAYVADLFHELAQVSGRIEITKKLAELFSRATPEEAQIISYLSLGELRAPYHGTQFALAEKSLKALLADYFGRSEQELQARLIQLGDLGLLFHEWAGEYRSNHEITAQHTLKFIYRQLCSLELISGTGSQEERSRLLQKLFNEVSPESGALIVRIVLGKLRLGFSDMTLLDALSWSVAGDKSLHDLLEQSYNRCADIGLIAFTLKKEGPEGVAGIHIQLGIPIRPAAAERASEAQQVIERIGTCIAQPKIDGFRLQIHKNGNKIFFFSRNLLSMTGMFPDIEREILKVPVHSFIIEGEAVAYDQETDVCMPFQHTISRKRKHEVSAAADILPLTFLIFDLLYAGSVSTLSWTHRERREKLYEIFGKPHEGALTVIPEKLVSNAREIQLYFDHALAQGFEGLVLKKPDSVYQAGKRNFNWIKLKRQAGTRLQDSIDAVIVGYYPGQGRRTVLGIGAFLVASYDSQEDRFKTIAKVGTGLTDLQWRNLKEQCDFYAVQAQPNNLVCSAQLAPAVWVSPALVCEIQADEITVSPGHSAGYALRFPRFISLRSDKSPDDATTVEELKRLYQLGL